MSQPFQRARNPEQREVRRAAILAVATEMLAQMPVASVTLNDLARRAGLAKSNVLRYFESREAILLELLVIAAGRWLARQTATLPAKVTTLPEVRDRVARTGTELASAFVADPVLCDLLSAHAAVLEHNVSAQAAATYRRGVDNELTGLAALLDTLIPELGPRGADETARTLIVFVGALWSHTHPSRAMLDAYRDDPTLNTYPDFADQLARTFTVIATGVLALPTTPRQDPTDSPPRPAQS